MDNKEFIEGILRKAYQASKLLPSYPITTQSVKDLLDLYDVGIGTKDLNDMLHNIGFRSEPIQNHADRLWYVVQKDAQA